MDQLDFWKVAKAFLKRCRLIPIIIVCSVSSLDFVRFTRSTDSQSSEDIESIEVVKTWQDLLNRPAISIGQGSAKLGIEKRNVPAMSGIILYCLTEGYALPKEWAQVNRLGPFTVEVKHESQPWKKNQSSGKSMWKHLRIRVIDMHCFESLFRLIVLEISAFACCREVAKS